jgi:hypothetical protein
MEVVVDHQHAQAAQIGAGQQSACRHAPLQGNREPEGGERE